MSRIRRRHLPSLGSFATFEVAARHLSFTRAARELNVTQGAVSQQVRLLEQALDMALFIRRHNALDLTPAGEELLQAVTAGLDTISGAVSVLSGEEVPQTVTISATNAMAEFWLQPLISGFRHLYPEVGFVILASDEDDTMRNYADVDIAIICGNERCDVGEELHFLFPEEAQPVCTPEFLARFGPFDDADSLNRVNLLHLHERHWSADAIGWQPLGWPEWFRAQGAEWLRGPSSLMTNKVNLLMAVALAGEGVMLGWQHMVWALIRQGKLVYAHPAPLTVGRGNFLICNKKSLGRASVSLFQKHLLNAAQIQSARTGPKLP